MGRTYDLNAEIAAEAHAGGLFGWAANFLRLPYASQYKASSSSGLFVMGTMR